MAKTNKYALVTGGSRGIGREICLKLGGCGYHVLVNYKSNAAEAEKTLSGIRAAGGDGEALQFDVASGEESAAAIAAWQKAHESACIEVVVNNAGIRDDVLMMWMEPQQWHSVIGTSLDGFYNVTRPLLKGMLVNRFGRIVNIVSLSGQLRRGQGRRDRRDEGAGAGGGQEGGDGERHRPGVRAHGHDRRHRRGGAQETDTRRTLLRTGRSRRPGDVPHLGTSLLHHGGGHFDQRGIIYLRPWRRE